MIEHQEPGHYSAICSNDHKYFANVFDVLVSPSSEFDHFARIASTICNTPIAAVTILKNGTQWVKGASGAEIAPMPSENSLCIHTIRQAKTTEVCDTSLDLRMMNNHLVTGPDGFRFYAGTPLIGPDGVPVGALCVIDTTPRAEGLLPEQRQALEMLAAQASLQLKLQLALAERDASAHELHAAVLDLRWSATHDPMTGLGNRTLLRKALDEIQSDGSPAALFAIDVDHFKRVNDSFGHQAGDDLLKEIARRLTASVRANDVLIRLGGDEFAIVLRNVRDIRDIDSLGARLLDAMKAPFHCDGRAIECSITVGAARAPCHTANSQELVRFADAALYDAKAKGRGCFVQFNRKMLVEQTRSIAQVTRARQALANGWIVPFYQPKVDLVDGSLLGLEALLRIQKPGGQINNPDSISAAFKEASLAQAIGETMLMQVLQDMQIWLAAGVPFGRVAVNVSATEVGDPGFAAQLLQALVAHDIPPRLLEIEIIEDVLLDQRSSAVLATMRALSKAGIQIAFDDFGTGHAALAHLPRFPVDVLKIDRSFVARIGMKSNQAIIAAMVSIARELGLQLIAEGVETPLQAAELIRLGCSAGQGFLYSRAVPASKISHHLASRWQSGHEHWQFKTSFKTQGELMAA